MGQDLVKNSPGSVDSLEYLLGLSGDDKMSQAQFSEARGEAEACGGLLIRGSANKVDQLLSSVKSSRVNLDSLPR